MADNDSPMLRQYRAIKEQHRDAALFFRMGDFYEMFEQDAREISSLLDLTLTQRNGVPMCGIPYHAAQTYIARLLKHGRKIAVCEQTHIPPDGRGLATREVVEVITPGTLVDEGLLDSGANNYLVAFGGDAGGVSFAYVDLSTAEFFCTSVPWEERLGFLRRELHRLGPKEIIIQQSLHDSDASTASILAERDGILINKYPDWMFNQETGRANLERQFGVANLKGFGISASAPELAAAGALLDYVAAVSHSLLPHITEMKRYGSETWVSLDESTQRNLEIVSNLHDGSRRYTLMEVLDHCRTSMGTRQLKRWLLTPLRDAVALRSRQDVVDFFYHNQILLAELRDALGSFLDLERLVARVAMDRAHPKDLLSLGTSLEAASSVNDLLQGYPQLVDFSERLARGEGALGPIRHLLGQAIADDAPVLLTEGGIFRDGYNQDLDRLRGLRADARVLLRELLEQEQTASKIPSLKLRYNRVLGYFFEVTKSNLDRVPEHFLRRQSLVGSERYTTERLTELESEISTAEEKGNELEKSLFLETRSRVKTELVALQSHGATISEVDVLQSFAMAATIHGYTRPRHNSDGRLAIEEGRHPVVEANLVSGSFVPNNLTLGPPTGSFVLLTGPNMAGKSTYLRQAALIVLLAQIGSFVPAADADLPIVDKIFCRVGATDNLARGESTFLVEMNETAHILRAATPNSLVIMDEVGRGTSTNDGLAIAWAVSSHILKTVRAKTLFATHFHELSGLSHPEMINLSMDVTERDGEIVFLKRVRSGSSDNSYGIHVAKLAGIPDEVIRHARTLLADLVGRREPDREGQRGQGPDTDTDAKTNGPRSPTETGLFREDEMVLASLASLDLDKITPLDALNLLASWRKQLGYGNKGGRT